MIYIRAEVVEEKTIKGVEWVRCRIKDRDSIWVPKKEVLYGADPEEWKKQYLTE